jgi:hypothetical protein
VELLEVDRTRLREYGLWLASPGSDGISGSADVNKPGLTLQDLRTLTASDVVLAGVPGIYYRLLKNDVNTRTLANPQLRTSEGIAAQARFGERVPIPVTTFAPIASGGVNQQPITSFNYENIGVNIDILPRMHHDDEVSLTLKIALSNISGTGFGGLPTFGNREISTTIRLRRRENMLAGLIPTRNERPSGIQGLRAICRSSTPVRQQPQGDATDRHRPHVDAAHPGSDLARRTFALPWAAIGPASRYSAPDPADENSIFRWSGIRHRATGSPAGATGSRSRSSPHRRARGRRAGGSPYFRACAPGPRGGIRPSLWRGAQRGLQREAVPPHSST